MREVIITDREWLETAVVAYINMMTGDSWLITGYEEGNMIGVGNLFGKWWIVSPPPGLIVTCGNISEYMSWKNIVKNSIDIVERYNERNNHNSIS